MKKDQASQEKIEQIEAEKRQSKQKTNDILYDVVKKGCQVFKEFEAAMNRVGKAIGKTFMEATGDILELSVLMDDMGMRLCLTREHSDNLIIEAMKAGLNASDAIVLFRTGAAPFKATNRGKVFTWRQRYKRLGCWWRGHLVTVDVVNHLGMGLRLETMHCTRCGERFAERIVWAQPVGW